MKLKNIEMEQYILSLSNFLDRIDMIGYAAARNTRILENAYGEYNTYRTSLLNKYGSVELDSNNKPTGRVTLSIDDENFSKYVSEIEEFASIEHEVQLFKIPYSEVIGKLSGSEILEIDWMLEDSDKPIEV